MWELADRRERYQAPELMRQMAGAQTTEARFAALEGWLAGKLADAVLDWRVSAAIQATAESSGEVRIEEVARRCGVSRRQLERLMRVWVGVAPKRLARVARFQALLGKVADGSVRDWTRMGAEYYADQSHLIHEFAEFAGASPRRFYAGQTADASAARCA
jgi:methylphosphotriester-DNA--protein-cysteine methyltransferase